MTVRKSNTAFFKSKRISYFVESSKKDDLSVPDNLAPVTKEAREAGTTS
jgi:hypothetical protein